MSNLFEHCRAGVSSASAKDTIKPSAEASASLIMPRRSIYDEVKDTNKREQCQIYLNIAEREYLRRQPKIRLSRMQCKFICFLPRRSTHQASAKGTNQLRHLLLRVSKKNVTKGFLWCEVDRIVFFRIFASIGK